MNLIQPFTLNLNGRLYDVTVPQVMAIINITDDSFYADSRAIDPKAIAGRARELAADGADILDLGACSTRPGSKPVDPDIETHRIVTAVKAVRDVLPDIPLSVDTFRASVAREAINAGADIINDISGGNFDPLMFPTIASLKAPYILTHTRGTPETMQSMTTYTDVAADVVRELSQKVEQLRLMGVCDIIVDPGLGFAKTVEQNYRLLDAIPQIAQLLECPVLIGASRKSMLTKPLGITASQALNATTVVNTIALIHGAAFIRVHDPLQARQAVTLVSMLPVNNRNKVYNLTNS